MSFKKKLLVLALAFGTIAGFGSGIAHMKGKHCHRSEWRQTSGPCERSFRQHHHWNHRGNDQQKAPTDQQLR